MELINYSLFYEKMEEIIIDLQQNRNMKEPEVHQELKKSHMNIQKNFLQQPAQSPRIKRTQSSHMSPYRQIKSSSQQINGRYHHCSILHKQKLYVYGGFDNDVGVLGDFKVFSCSHQNHVHNKTYEWEDISITGNPGPRHSHSAVQYEGSIYIFGGKVDRFTSTNSIHAYNIQNRNWKLIDPHNEPIQTKSTANNKKQKSLPKQPQNTDQIFNYKPYPIDSHQSVVYKNQMIVFGGFANNQYQNDIFAFNFEDKQWKKIYSSLKKHTKSGTNSQSVEDKRLQPQPRSDFSMVVYNYKLYIHAGRNLDKIFNDLWEFNLETLQFRQIITTTPHLDFRSGHSAVVYKQYMLVFGGISTVTNQKDDLLCYSFHNQKWVTLWGNKIGAHLDNKVEKKVSSLKNKMMESSMHKSKHENVQNNNEEKQNRKYRRPLAEQKQTVIKSEKKREKQRTKKKNERKYFLINQLETPSGTLSPLHEKSTNEQFNPLIQSLTNSIMLTSNAFNKPAMQSSRQGMKNALLELDTLKQRGKRLKARDGHTAHILGNQMLIFGGDRHMFSINDLVFVNLDYLMEIIEIKLKEKQGKPVFSDNEQQEQQTNNQQN